MRRILVAIFLLLAPPGTAQTVETLTVCLPRNAGVIAGRRLTGGSGFDYRIAAEVADRIGRDLSVIWYENDLDENSDAQAETYAMLSAGLCDAVPGYPRYQRAVGPPLTDRARLPRWLGMPQEIDRDSGLMADVKPGFVELRPITVTAGYMRAGIGIAYREGAAEPTGLDDIGGRVLAIQQGTMSGAIAMLQTPAAVRARIMTYNPGAGFLWQVEAGPADLAMVDIAAFDSFRQSNPITRLRLAAWRHEFGMDLGFAILARNSALRDAISAALTDLVSDGSAARLAAEAGLTYVPAEPGDLLPKLDLTPLRRQP